EFTERRELNFLIAEGVDGQGKEAIGLFGIAFTPGAEQNEIFTNEHAGEPGLQCTPVVNRYHILQEPVAMLTVGLKHNLTLIALPPFVKYQVESPVYIDTQVYTLRLLLKELVKH